MFLGDDLLSVVTRRLRGSDAAALALAKPKAALLLDETSLNIYNVNVGINDDTLDYRDLLKSFDSLDYETVQRNKDNVLPDKVLANVANCFSRELIERTANDVTAARMCLEIIGRLDRFLPPYQLKISGYNTYVRLRDIQNSRKRRFIKITFYGDDKEPSALACRIFRHCLKEKGEAYDDFVTGCKCKAVQVVNKNPENFSVFNANEFCNVLASIVLYGYVSVL